MKYKISKKIGAYSVAGVLLANNIPVLANSSLQENIAITDKEQEENIENKGEATSESVSESISEEVTEATSQEIIEEATESISQDVEGNATLEKENVAYSVSTEISSTEQSLTTVTEQEFWKKTSTDESKLKVKNPEKFVLYGENNPTKEKITEENKNEIEKYDTAGNNNGYVELSERLSWEIKYAIDKTLKKIGTNVAVQKYKVYTAPTVQEDKEIEISNAIKEAAGLGSKSSITYADVKNIT